MEYFFTFKSNDDKFLFGCNIVSLLHLIKNKTSVKNPYNRENIKIDVYRDLENGFTNNVTNKNDDTSPTSFQKLWESWSLWDIFNCENNKTSILKEKRF